jgi:hypothetical protein
MSLPVASSRVNGHADAVALRLIHRKISFLQQEIG